MSFSSFPDIWKLPLSEQDEAWHLQCKARDLEDYLNRFSHALALFDYADVRSDDQMRLAENPMYFTWMFVAAREAALSAYHFRSALHSLKHNVEKCPTILKGASLPTIQSAIEEFDMKFPGLCEVRHAIAHEADQTFSLNEKQKHTIQNDAITNMWGNGNLHDREFIFTRNRQVVSIGITENTRNTLKELAAKALGALQQNI